MTYELLLVPRAEEDVSRIVHYLSQRSPQGAATWCECLEQAFADLRSEPLKYALAPESAEYGTDVRQTLFKTPRGRT